MTATQTKYEQAAAAKTPDNTIVRICRKSNDETIDWMFLPGTWTWEQAHADPDVQQMISASVGTLKDCYLAVWSGG